MILGFIDIPYTELEKYWQAVKKKKKTCKVLPQGRFDIWYGHGIKFDGLVCKDQDMGDESTGLGAASCKNCTIKRRKKRK